MNQKQKQNHHSPPELYKIAKEQLKGTNITLTDFFFHEGGNLYVLSYDNGGVRKHTAIDTGDLRFQHQIKDIFVDNDINPSNIERIIITHRHRDHCGLADLLARESRATILAHPNFERFIEGDIREEERMRMRDFDPRPLKEHNIVYLPQPVEGKAKHIGGVDFPILGEPINIGDGGQLEIITCPEDILTHSPDQLLVLYSPGSHSQAEEKRGNNFRPTDNIIFSGDLWLMRGPLFNWNFKLSRYLKFRLFMMKNALSGRSMRHADARDQDATAKDALKKGFDLIRVKPGHGEEFIGSSLVPRSLFASRDLLLELGYSMDADRAILKKEELAQTIANLEKQAYNNFVRELLFWRELGYSPDEASRLIIRIYKEQSGGGKLVERDRKERRQKIKATLSRLKDDDTQPEELRQLAQSTLSKLQRGKL